MPRRANEKSITRTLRITRRVPVRHEVDVFIAGGGPAGLAAGITAARQGARVCLVEDNNCFGGMGTSGLLALFGMASDGVHFLAGGFAREVYDRLWADGGAGLGAQRNHPCGNLNFKPEVLKRIYDDMVETSGMIHYLCTHCIGLEQKAGKLTHAIGYGKSGLFAVRAHSFIDATGDGDLAAWAGAPLHCPVVVVSE